MENDWQEPGESHQVVFLAFDPPRLVCSHTHSGKYNTLHFGLGVALKGTLYFALNWAGVGVYLERQSNLRPLSQKEIESCEIELFHWVKKLRLIHLLEGCPESIEGCLLGRVDAPASLGIVHDGRIWA